MSEHGKKIIAPIIITIIMIAYWVIYFGVLIRVVDNVTIKVLLAVIPVILGATMIGVCIQRINEIKGGEEDDLSKY